MSSVFQIPIYRAVTFFFCHFERERWERRQWRRKRPERVAAVDKIEEMRKPEDFIGHRNSMQRGVEKSVIPVARERISPLAYGSVEMTCVVWRLLEKLEFIAFVYFL